MAFICHNAPAECVQTAKWENENECNLAIQRKGDGKTNKSLPIVNVYELRVELEIPNLYSTSKWIFWNEYIWVAKFCVCVRILDNYRNLLP